MGIFSDLRVSGKAFDVTPPITALCRRIHRELTGWITRGDANYFEEVLPHDEVQVISQLVPLPGMRGKSGKYVLNFTLASGETFPSRKISLKANTNAIDNAIRRGGIDANITDWNSTSVQVSAGTTLMESDIELTFSGPPVGLEHQGQTTIDIDSKAEKRVTLSDTPWLTLKVGQPTVRSAWAALVAMGVVRILDIPSFGETPKPFVPVTNHGNNANYPSQETLKALALEAAIDDNNADTETVILASTGLL